MQKIKYLTKEESCWVKSYFARKGLSISAVAKKIGMSRESLSARVNGTTDFERKEMVEIALVLEASPEEIFFAQKVT